MAIKKVMVGPFGPYLYDDSKVIADASFGGRTYGGLVTTGSAHADEGVTNIGTAGVSDTITMIVALQYSGATLQQKTRTITVVDGVITAIGAISGWVNV